MDIPALALFWSKIELMTFNSSDLIIIAGRPAMGKTALALNIATNVATKSKKPLTIAINEVNDGEVGYEPVPVKEGFK